MPTMRFTGPLSRAHRKGFDVANDRLGATRLQVGASCLGRADRAFSHSVDYAAQRQQFGQSIGKFQGVSFKLADMAMEMKAAELMIMDAGWRYDHCCVPKALSHQSMYVTLPRVL